jgi:hypothetical protein
MPARTERRRQLTAAFNQLMARNRKPIEPLNARPDQRGPKMASFRITTNGKTIRLRTNKDGWLMSHAKSAEAGADMGWVDQTDFIGFIYPKPDAPNTAVGYLAPVAVANAALRDAHVAFLGSPPTRGRDPNRQNTLRAICFEGNTEKAWYGFACRWERYRIGEIDLEPVVDVRPDQRRPLLAESVARHKAQLAAETGYPESAIRITFGDPLGSN